MISKTRKKLKLTLPAKATVFYTLTGALERGVGFVFTPIYTRILTPEEYGLYPLYVSWMGIATVIVTLELTGSTVYRGLSSSEGGEKKFISSLTGLYLTCAVITCGVILSFGRAVRGITGLNTTLLVFLLLQTVLNGVIGIYFAKCRYEYKYKTASLINLANAILSPPLSLLIIRFTDYKAEARIIAPLVIGIAISIPIIIKTFVGGRTFFDGGVWKGQLGAVIPLLPHFLATTVTVQSSKLAIAYFFGEDALARYSLVFSFGFIFTVMTVGINSGLTPWINRKLSHGEKKRVGEMCEELFSLFSILSVMAIAFVPEGLSILAPHEYLDALPAVYPIAISVIISFLTTVFYTVTVYFGKGHLVTLTSILSMLVTLILHLTVTPRFGYVGAGVVACAAGVVNVLSYTVIIGGVLKKRIFSLKKLLAPILFSIAFSYLLYLFRASWPSRLSLFLALLILLLPRAIGCYRLIREKDKARY